MLLGHQPILATQQADTIRFEAIAIGSLEIQAADGKAKTPRFEMTAYSGGPMALANFAYPVIADIAGMKTRGEDLPILRNHSQDRVVGHADQIEITEAGVRVRGLISGTGADAREVVEAASNGFPWKASIGASAGEVEFVDRGKSVRVNGQDFDGPIYVARTTEIGEVSFVASGADPSASARVAASMDQANDADSLAAYRETQAREEERIVAIREVCGQEHSEVAIQAIREGWTVDRTELHVLRASRPSVPFNVLGANRADSGLSEATCFEAQAFGLLGLDELCEQTLGERAAEVAASHRPASLIELSERLLAAQGVSVPRDRYEIARRAFDIRASGFSTLSVPTLLSNVMNKIAIESHREEGKTFEAWTRSRSVRDFKPATMLRANVDATLEEVGATGEVKHGTIGEETYSAQIKTYARQLALTRQDVINDDLGALETVPQEIGREAARALADLVYTTLLGNGGSFFSSGNANYLAGSSTALGLDSLTSAIALMRKQVDADGRVITMSPKTLLVPVELEAHARALLNSMEIQRATDDPGPTGNSLKGVVDTLAVEPRLSNTGYSGSSTVGWYLFAATSKNPFFVAYLNGRKAPTIEYSPSDFDTLGVRWRGYHDFGVSFGDPRAAVFFRGEAEA